MKDILYTRRYQGQDGQERKEYITVGYMFEKEGRITLLMKPYINLGALANEKGEVWLGAYEHKPKTSVNSPKTAQKPQEAKPVINTEPTVEEITKVVNDGKQYAEKWSEMAKPKAEDDEVPF